MKPLRLIAFLVTVRCVRRALFLCCLFSVFSAIAAQAQAPAGHRLWKQTYFTGTFAYSPAQSLIAASQGFGEIALLRADGTLVQTIHTGQGPILTLAFAPDGRTLAAGGNDHSIKLWRLSTAAGSNEVREGDCVHTFTGHTKRVISMAFAPDGQTLASSSSDETVKLWNVNTGACLQTLSGYVHPVLFAPDGQTLAGGSDDGIILWRVRDGACLKTLSEHKQTMHSLAFSPDGQMLAAGGSAPTSVTGIINIWRVSDGVCLQTLSGHTNTVTSVAFAPDGQTLASTGYDMTIKLWRVNDGICRQTITGNTDFIFLVAFSPDGHTLVSGGRFLKLWRVGDGSCLHTLTGQSNCVFSLAFSPSGQMLATGDDDGTVKLLRARDGACLRTLTGHTACVETVAFSSNGRMLASSTVFDHTIRLWRVRDGACLRTLRYDDDRVCSVAFSPDGQTLASGSENHTIKLWRVRDGACLRTLRANDDNKRVTPMGVSPGGVNTLPDAASASPAVVIPMNLAPVTPMDFSPAAVRSVTFSPDGQTLASGSDNGSIKLWRVRDGACLHTLTGHTGEVEALVFAPNGQTLASGSRDNTIKLWRVRDGACRQTLIEPQAARDLSLAVRSVAFAPDGRMLASGNDSGTVKLWRVRDGVCRQSFSGQTYSELCVAFTPDGQTLAAGGADGLALWRAYPPATAVTSTQGTASARSRHTPLTLAAFAVLATVIYHCPRWHWHGGYYHAPIFRF